MEHAASERVKESHTAMPVKTEVDKAAPSTTCRGVQTNANFTEEETALAGDVKSEPALLVKEEVMGDGWQDIADLQCGPSTSTIVGSTNVFDSLADPGNTLNVKEELGAIDIGPTVLQHTDTWYTTNQPDVSIIRKESRIKDNNMNAILGGEVKEEFTEDDRRADTYDQRSKEAAQSEQQARFQLYSCDKCAKTYAFNKSLLEHYRNRHSTESHECTKCNKNFPSKLYLYNHTIYAHSEQQYECAVCKKICKSKTALYQHVNQVHRARPAADTGDQHSNKAAQSKQRAQSHLYSCGKCGKTYTKKKYLMKHYRNLHSTESHKCKKCNKNFPSKAYLYKHTSSAHSEQQYECAVCKKIYKSRQALNHHLDMVHRPGPAGLQIHTCEYCQKTFRYKSGLWRHTKSIHVAGHIHRCPRCNENFKSSDMLQRHNSSIHGKPHKCQVCLKFYKTIYNLGLHFKKAHNSKDIQFQSHAMPDLRPSADVTNAAASTSRQQRNVDVVKEEPADAELELGPVVFQHMDCNYRPYEEEPQDGSGD